MSTTTSTKYQAKIKRDGTLEFLGKPPPGFVMPGTKRVRFSEIVPQYFEPRWVFRLLRWIFGEDGRVAAWTRTWRIPWEATILIGPARGLRRRSMDREFLIHWEQQVWRNN